MPPAQYLDAHCLCYNAGIMPARTLTDAQVAEIRAAKHRTQAELCRAYGVSKTVITAVLNRQGAYADAPAEGQPAQDGEAFILADVMQSALPTDDSDSAAAIDACTPADLVDYHCCAKHAVYLQCRRNGNTQKAAAGVAGLSVAGISNKKAADESFAAADAAAESAYIADVEAYLSNAAQMPENWRAALEILQRRRPEDWGKPKDSAPAPFGHDEIIVVQSAAEVGNPGPPPPVDTPPPVMPFIPPLNGETPLNEAPPPPPVDVPAVPPAAQSPPSLRATRLDCQCRPACTVGAHNVECNHLAQNVEGHYWATHAPPIMA